MFGNKILLLVFFLALIPSFVLPIFAASILVDFDKLEYHTGDEITISGIILEYKMPVIAMSIFDPDGEILSANSLEVDSGGFFSKTFFLDSNFYNKPGEYKIKFDYGKITQNEYFTIIQNNFEEDIFIALPTKSEIVFLLTDKTVYTDKDIITITGLVSSIDSPTVLIGIYDTFENPAGFYFGSIDSNLEFSTTVPVKAGVNFKMDGIYSIKAHYGESEATTSFTFAKDMSPINDVIEEENHTNTPADMNSKVVIETTNNLDPTIESTSTSNILIVKNDIVNTTNNLFLEETPKDNFKATTTPGLPFKKNDNLSVEDIELGKLLNQINLACDRSKFTDVISYYDGMGPALYRLCKFDQALIYFDNSLITDPNNVEILTNKGSVLGKLGKLSDSITYYDLALEINPKFIPAINNKANALANMGKYDESISLYTNAIEENPSFSTARKNLGLILSEMSTKDSITFVTQDSIPNETKPEKFASVDDSSVLYLENSEHTLENSTEVKIGSSNFFEQLGLAFSSFGSLFSFLN